MPIFPVTSCEIYDRVSHRGSFHRVVYLLLLLLLSLVTGCAKVGDPKPPLRTPPPLPGPVEVIREGEAGVLVRVPLPAGGKVSGLLLYRSCTPEGRLQRVQEVRSPDLREVAGHFVVRDAEPSPDRECIYAVRFVGETGDRSELSPVITVPVVQAPGPPREVRADVSEAAVVVHWLPPAEEDSVVGYWLNRRELVKEPRWVVEDFHFGEPITLSIQSVASTGPVWIVSDPVEFSITPRDVFPPPVPQGLQALWVENGVQLFWDEVMAADLAGYRVYRRERGATGWAEAIAETILNRYLDTGVPEAGRGYEYAVSAFDAAGNESGRSRPGGIGATGTE